MRATKGMSYYSRTSGVLIGLVLLSCPLANVFAQANTLDLVLGAPIERHVKQGEVHPYRISLAAGQYLHVRVRKRVANIAVKVFAPNGEQIGEVTFRDNRLNDENVYALADHAGEYRMEVSPSGKSEGDGFYAIVVEELRPATAEDQVRIAAQKLLMTAAQLRKKDTAESRKQAIETCSEALSLWKSINDQEECARTLHVIGQLYYSSSDDEKAIASYTDALPFWKAAHAAEGEALAHYAIGMSYTMIGQHQKALPALEQALSISQSLNDKPREADTLKSISRVYEGMGDYKKAIDYHLRILDIRKSLTDREGEAVELHDIGTVYYYLADYQKAIDYNRQSLPIRLEIGDRDGEAYDLNGIGLAYLSMGDSLQPLEYFEKSLQIWKEVGNRQGEGLGLHNLAGLYVRLDDLQKALDYFERAARVRREVGDRQGEAQSLSQVGNLYITLGDYQHALDYFNEALPLRRLAGDRRGEAYTLNSFGIVSVKVQDYANARGFHSQALSIFETVGDKDGQARALNGLGDIETISRNYEKALEYYNHGLGLYRAIGNRLGEAETLNNVARIYSILTANDRALETYQAALDIAHDLRHSALEAILVAGVAQVDRDRNDLAAAQRHIEAALNSVESSRKKILSQENRASFFSRVRDYYDFYIDLLMRLEKLKPSAGYAGAALVANERARARTLLETVAESHVDIREGVDSVLIAREGNLHHQLDSKADRLTRMLNGKHTPEQAAAAGKEVESLLNELRGVEAEIKTKSPRYAALTQPQPLNLKEIQDQVLDNDDLLLEYSLGKERSFLWAVTKVSIASYELPGRDEIEAAAKHFYELLFQSNKTELRTQAKLAAMELSRVILGPVAGELGRKRLVIVADGFLQYIPFAALSIDVQQDPRSTRTERAHASSDDRPVGAGYHPLVLDHEIVSLPSASTLAVLRREILRRPPAGKTVAVFADPVLDVNDRRVTTAKAQTIAVATPIQPGKRSNGDLSRSMKDFERLNLERLAFTREEAETIVSLAGKSNSLIALDFKASKETASNSEVSNYRILHIAAHGLINSQHPDLSGIVLSLVNEDGKPQDGFLRLHDIYNLKLNADMVVLSACQTALGKEVRGEGLISLTRGFMYAGAARVVASLWDVKDEATAELMKRFYQGMLKDGMRPAAALRAAQVSMSTDKRWEAPYYWAGFVLQGEWR